VSIVGVVCVCITMILTEVSCYIPVRHLPLNMDNCNARIPTAVLHVCFNVRSTTLSEFT
jgi:hypothetical protein